MYLSIMKSKIAFTDWLLIAILIVLFNIGFQAFGTPVAASAQERQSSVAAAMSADGKRAVVAKHDKYVVVGEYTGQVHRW